MRTAPGFYPGCRRKAASRGVLIAALITVSALGTPPADAAPMMTSCGATLALTVVPDAAPAPGATLVVRNTGSRPCTVGGLPTLRFVDQAGAELPAMRQAPPGMHPGPMVLPVVLSPDNTATASLHWTDVASPTSPRCVQPARVVMSAMTDNASAAWTGGAMCGPTDTPIRFSQSQLRH